jgi:lysozyme
VNLALLREELLRYEGCKYNVYLDSLGLKTAGIGHLLIGVDRDFAIGQPIPANAVEIWFAADVTRSTNIAKSCITNFDKLDDCRQRVLTQLAFNMGNKLLGFKNMLAEIERQDFVAAAIELQNSKWFGQVGRRGIETCVALQTGAYNWRK